MPTYTFNEAEARVAHDEWGFNCGPAALAFALQVSPDVVRSSIPQFDERRYTNPTMMRQALHFLVAGIREIRPPREKGAAFAAMFAGPMTLVRVQWTGPWIVDGKPAKWAARQTHWIATWAERKVPLVFDINGGIHRFERWEDEIVPVIVATVDRADGGWYPANIWRVVDSRASAH